MVMSLAISTRQAHSQWAKRLDSGSGQLESITNLQFYLHDIFTGSNPTASRVVEPVTNSTATYFGAVVMADDPLTETPDLNSRLVGRAQGMYGMSGRKDAVVLMVMSYGFVDGAYSGSSISIMGRNPVMDPNRELPVLGGTGVFRMARGYAVLNTVSSNAGGDAVVHYNVTVHSPTAVANGQ
ncbi:Dirigent protein 23 [Linum grandiflorum]